MLRRSTKFLFNDPSDLSVAERLDVVPNTEQFTAEIGRQDIKSQSERLPQPDPVHAEGFESRSERSSRTRSAENGLKQKVPAQGPANGATMCYNLKKRQHRVVRLSQSATCG